MGQAGTAAAVAAGTDGTPAGGVSGASAGPYGTAAGTATGTAAGAAPLTAGSPDRGNAAGIAVKAPAGHSGANGATVGAAAGSDVAAAGVTVAPDNPASASMAGPVDGTAGAGSGGFAAVFDAIVADIVLHLMPRGSAVPYLQQIGRQRLPEAQQPAFVQYSLDRLSHLTLGECLRHGLEPSQYELWRQQYAPGAEHDQGRGTKDQRLESRHSVAGNPQCPKAGDEASAAEDATGASRSQNTGGWVAAGGDHADTGRHKGTGAPTEADPLAQVVAPILDAVLHTATGSTAPVFTGPRNGSAVPASVPRAVPTAALQPAVKVLIDSVGRYLPGGISPAASAPLAVVFVLALWYALNALIGSAWTAVLVCVALLAVAALVALLRRRAPAVAAPGGATRTAGFAPAADATGADATGASRPQNTDGFVAAGAARAADATGASRPQETGGQRRWRWLAAVAGCVLLIAVAAGGLWYRGVQRPGKEAIRAYLTKAVAQLPLNVSAPEVAYGTRDATGYPLTYHVLLETTEPLYRRVDFKEYLRAHAPAELAAIDAAAALLRGPNGARIAAAVAADQRPGTKDQGPGADATGESRSPASSIPQSTVRDSQPVGAASAGTSLPPESGNLKPEAASLQVSGLTSQVSDFSSLLLVTTQTPAGKAAIASGSLVAWRREGAWVFTGSPVPIDRTVFAGEPKPAGAVAVDLPADAARLQALVAAQVAYAAKVQAAAAALAAEAEREHQQRAATFTQLLRPGTLFTGTIVDPARGGPQRVVIEITDLAASSGTLAAVLRNDGGWADARPFQGGWTLNPEADLCTVTLRTSRTDSVDGAGPVLQDRLDLSLTLQVRPDGSATAGSGNAVMHRVDPADAPAVKAEALRPLAPAVDATQPGKVYHGTVTSRVAQTTELVVLRFTGDGPAIPATDPGAPVVRATLESATTPGWRRVFQGTIIGNTYRAGTLPIRLRSADAERVVQASGRSILGFNSTNNGLVLALRVDGDRLVGQDNWFSYAFVATDGRVGSSERGSVENGDGKVESREGGNVGNGTAGKDQGPGTKDQGPQTGGNAKGGTRDAEAPADSQTWPSFPGATGAYVLVDGAWAGLPTNNGKTYQTIAEKLLSKLLRAELWEDQLAGKPKALSQKVVGSVRFDGREVAPRAPGKEVVIAYVGPLAAPTAEQVNKYPALKDYPALELIRLEADPNGVRIAPLQLVGPDSLGFGSNRVDAVVEQPQPGVTVLRARAALGAGRYALAGAPALYELETK